MYSSPAYYADQGPPPPPRPSSGYDQYSASYPSQSYHGHPLSQSQSHSPRLPAQTHRPQGSRPVSFSGYSTAPQHRPSYQPAPHSFQQPIPHASPPAVAIHDYSRPGDTPGVAWPEPQRRRPSGGYDLTPPDLDSSFGRLSLSPSPQLLPSPYPIRPDARAHSPAPPSTPPITCQIPTADRLLHLERSLDGLADNDKLHWAQDVLRALDRHLHPEGHPFDFEEPSLTGESGPAPTRALQDLLNIAIPIIISFTTHRNSSIAALASYLKASLLSTGSAPDFLPRDPRQAFKDFEIAARGGEARAWYRLGRDYEGVGDMSRARDCYERGRARGDIECLYRMAMANLLGQLQLPPNPQAALPLLAHAANEATTDCPQPAYVYGMLLAGELEGAFVPASLILPNASTSPALDAQHAQARQHLERAAYLCYPPAQYKVGFLYEHAALGCPYDPLLSVQWYSLASQAGDFEADMALSKWFLCGAEGCFGKNEELARTFAAKAARAGLGTGCFALGYYDEVGIGGRRDTESARQWYQKAARVGNPDAITRLAALSQPAPQAISIQQHQVNMNNTLVRKRTQAQIRSDHQPGRPPRRQQQLDTLRVEAERQARRAAGNLSAVQERPYLESVPPQNRPPVPPAYGRRPSPSAPAPHLSPNMQPPKEPIYQHPQSPPQSQLQYPARPPAGPPQKKSSTAKPGPQTFADMGFVSKPVENESCVIM